MRTKPSVAVIGAGVSGLVSAYLLQRKYDVTLFEANDYAGGHVHTHTIDTPEDTLSVDSGFIVYNPHNYPLFCQLLDHLGVTGQPTVMSFSVRNDQSGFEYNATDIPGLFCRPANIISPAFWRMLRDIFRFYREAPDALANLPDSVTTEAFLRENGYSNSFIENHLLPMASALWSAPTEQAGVFPMRYMLEFFRNHRMLQISDRPQWWTIRGGSRTYVDALLRRFAGELRLSTAVRSVAKKNQGIQVNTETGQQVFDKVVFACHGDLALELIDQPTALQREILANFQYQDNAVTLHTDTSVLPKRKLGWAAWNAWIPQSTRKRSADCTVTYNMNHLQSLDAKETYCVSLNQADRISEAKILKQLHYRHPIYTVASVNAQPRQQELNQNSDMLFCGAYWGWGFHEDGVRSAKAVCETLGVAYSFPPDADDDMSQSESLAAKDDAVAI